MKDVLKIIESKLEELVKSEAEMRKENMQLQDRTNKNADYLATTAKLRAQFEEAKRLLEKK